jgi:YVTN family beta-propeller protein
MHGSSRKARRLVLPTIASMIAVAAFAVPGHEAGASAPTPAWTAWVVNANNANEITPIDLATKVAGTPIPVGDVPGSVAITPNGRTAYVSDVTGHVTPINLVTDTAETAIRVGSFPSAIAITPNGVTAYVANEMSDTVTPINTATNVAGTPIAVGANPFGIAITPDGATACVGNLGGASVTPIDIATGRSGTPISVGLDPFAIAITPNGATAYVVNEMSNTVTPINTATNVAGTPIPVGMAPSDIAITPDGTTAYVLSDHDDTITPIDTATNTTGSVIHVTSPPAGIAITPDGATAYVTSFQTGSVIPLDTATNTLGTPIDAGSSPLGIAITPDQAPVAKLALTATPLGAATHFDASASTVAYGGIASYAWNFGDGHTATTTVTTTMHTYAAAGAYTATVTETSTGGTSTIRVFTGETMSRNGSPSAEASRTALVVAPGAYTALAPFRICDTRAHPPSNPCHTLGGAGTITIQVTGIAGPNAQSVPLGAQAVVVNLTAINRSAANTYLSAFPADSAMPLASNINLNANGVRSNLAIVPLSSSGKLTLFNSVGSADAIVDVQGYFTTPAGSGAGAFHSFTPARICDTRGSGASACGGALPANTWRRVVLSSAGSIPATDAAAAVLNLTATGGTLATYLSVAVPNGSDACPISAPSVSNVNPAAGMSLPNRVIAALGPHEDICVYNSMGTIDFLIDVNGWFGNGSEAPPGALFYAVPPTRICDTRAGSGTPCAGASLTSRGIDIIPVAGVVAVPADGGPASPVAVIANLTGVAGNAATVFTLYPSDASRPLASDLNPEAGDVIANLAIVKIATSGPLVGDVDLFNSVGDINAILDVAGWFQ